MQGIRAHSDSFLASMRLECYGLLHYFERTRGHKGWILEPCKHGTSHPDLDRTSVLRRKTKVFFGFELHGCMEVVMQGPRAHSDSFLAAMWLEC